MISAIHQVDLMIKGRLVDVDERTTFRLNAYLNDPTQIQTKSAEYSFSISLPITPQNNSIFDFAHVLSKRSKFNKRYEAEVVVDGIITFKGDLLITSISKDSGFECSLYINKLNTVETIFGDSVLSEISNWEMDYEQETTINQYNNDVLNHNIRDCFFPLISYGAFQKYQNEDGTYESKHIISDKNMFYPESFYPSMNLLETVKRCFIHKGYTVVGDIFDDDVIKNIYMSTTLGSNQDPIFNLGNPNMGESEVTFTWTNAKGVTPSTVNFSGGTNGISPYVIQSLDESLWGVGRDNNGGSAAYNYEEVNVYDVWSSGSDFLTRCDSVNPYLWRKNRFVAPTDGYYEIEMTLSMSLLNTYYQYFNIWGTSGRQSEVQMIKKIPQLTFNNYPIEFQLTKNNNDGEIGLICPRSIDMCYSPTNVGTNDIKLISDSGSTIIKEYSAYPHEKDSNVGLGVVGYRPKSWSDESDESAMLNYDPRVNENFIMGSCFSMPHVYNSVIKNGRSWDATCSYTNRSRYTNESYYKLVREASLEGTLVRSNRTGTRVTTVEDPSYGLNYLSGSDNYIRLNGDTASAKITAIVYLQKNDYIQLKCIQRRGINAREYDMENNDNSSRGSNMRGSTDTDYLSDAAIGVNGHVKFRCYAPSKTVFNNPTVRAYEQGDKFMKNGNTLFSDKLNLANFLSNEEKMSDFINNFIKEFNLSYAQNGRTVTLNSQVSPMYRNVIGLDDRVAESEIESEAIDYPSQMSIQYAFDEEERGVYTSAEANATDEQIQSNDWLDYCDRGWTYVKLADDEWAEEKVISLKTSYNWYEKFTLRNNQLGTNIEDIMIPVQAKDEWLIDGYQDEESMKKDGYGLKRRYFFPYAFASVAQINLYGDKTRQNIPIMLCTNVKNNVDLCYKEISDYANYTLLTRYFDIKYDTDGNYINFNCYLNPQEYLDIKNGAYIRIDSDTYQPIEVSGYDPSGRNKASIKAIQKIIANDAKDKQYNPSNPTPTASTPTMIKNYTFTSNAPSVINDVSGSFTIITYNIDSYFVYGSGTDRNNVPYRREGKPENSFVDAICKEGTIELDVHTNPSSDNGRTEYVTLIQDGSEKVIMLTVNQKPFDRSDLTGSTSLTSVAIVTDVNGKETTLMNADGELLAISISGKSDIANVRILTSCTSIDEWTFSDCRGLTAITYDGTTEQWNNINKPYCLGNVHTSVSTVTCSNGSVDIGICYNGTSDAPIIQPNNVIYYTSTDGNIVTPYDSTVIGTLDSNTYEDGKGVLRFTSDITQIGELALYNCRTLKTIQIPDGVRILDEYSFFDCKSLVSIDIPNSVTTFGNALFQNCSKLETINYDGTKEQFCSISKVGDDWFWNVPTSCVVHCTNGDIRTNCEEITSGGGTSGGGITE